MAKTPQQMLEFWQKELEKIDEQEALEGITLWERLFIQAKIEIWQAAADKEVKGNGNAGQV